jgi:hypothetical protein
MVNVALPNAAHESSWPSNTWGQRARSSMNCGFCRAELSSMRETITLTTHEQKRAMVLNWTLVGHFHYHKTLTMSEYACLQYQKQYHIIAEVSSWRIKKQSTNSSRLELAIFLFSNGELKLKNVADFKEQPIFLIAFLLACTVFFASCSGDTSSNSSPVSLGSHAQTSATTSVRAQTTCLTVNSPALAKLASGNYKLVDEIDNCSRKDAGPLKITAHIDTETTKQSTHLMGPTTIPANGKATYQTFTGQTGSTNKEIHFPSPASSSAVVTLSVTINGVIQGEWDGQIAIPTHG